jgi:hypothetical protein
MGFCHSAEDYDRMFFCSIEAQHSTMSAYHDLSKIGELITTLLGSVK